jgi:hypothetical protein
MATAQTAANSPIYGNPGQQQFADAQVKLRNIALQAYIGGLLFFREEYLGDDSLQTRNGFDDVTLAHFKELLFDVDETRRLITDVDTDTQLVVLFPDLYNQTYNITSANAANSPATAAAATNTTTTAASNATAAAGPGSVANSGQINQNAASVNPVMQTLKMPASPLHDLPYALDGSDQNIPLNSQINVRSPMAMTILAIIDKAIVDATRCEDRFLSRYITPQTSQVFYGHLNAIWVAMVRLGGSANRKLINSGTRRSEEPRGATAAVNASTEASNVAPIAGAVVGN